MLADETKGDFEMKQSVHNQKGEIAFRRKVAEQQTKGKQFFKDELDSSSIEEILKDRMKKTLDRMRALKELGVTLSPYLEVGAERGQRSLVMENGLEAKGAAVDISFDMLKSCGLYNEKFEKKTLPLRICCDAHNLPFKTGSIPFVFCYQTLHHFPEPTPIVAEIHRVVSDGGCFFFDEEPFKRVLHFPLYTKKEITHWEKPRERGTIEKFIDFFLADHPCNEVDHGIIENLEIPLRGWRRALHVFDKKDVHLQSVRFIREKLYHPGNFVKYFVAYLLGGEISGVCWKAGSSAMAIASVYHAVICPECRRDSIESELQQRENSFFCGACGIEFPIIDGVALLFATPAFEELYPEYFEKLVFTRRTP